MHTFKIALTAALAVFSTPSLAQVTAPKVLEDLTALTTMSSNIINVLTPITTSSQYPAVIAASQSLSTRLQELLNTISDDVNAYQGSTPLTGSRPNIIKEFKSFSAVQQDMYAALSSKHKIFAQFLTAPSIAPLLRNLEAAVDALVFSLVALAPAGQNDFSTEGRDLDIGIQNAISIYSQTCVPSPLYPSVQPICASL